MRIFVLSTGRCGSTTLAKACSHITNFTSGHETNRGRVSLVYKDQHIEIDPHLTFNMPALKQLYPEAFFVRLWREKEACVKSLSKRGSMRRLWIPHAYQKKEATAEDALLAAEYFYEFFNGIIKKFTAFDIQMENFREDFKSFWQIIGAEGNLEQALNELVVKYNEGK